MWEQLTSNRQKNEVGPMITVYAKITKIDKDLCVTSKSMKFLLEILGVNLHNPGFWNGFLDLTPKT